MTLELSFDYPTFTLSARNHDGTTARLTVPVPDTATRLTFRRAAAKKDSAVTALNKSFAQHEPRVYDVAPGQAVAIARASFQEQDGKHVLIVGAAQMFSLNPGRYAVTARHWDWTSKPITIDLP